MYLCIKLSDMSQLNNLYSQWLDVQPLSSDDEKRLKLKFMLAFNCICNHIEGNTLKYELSDLLGEVIGSTKMKDLEKLKAHHIYQNMIEQEAQTDKPSAKTFIHQEYQVMLHEDYRGYRHFPGGETMWWYEGEIIRFSMNPPRCILHLLQSDPSDFLSTISTTIGKSRSARQKQVDNLAEKGCKAGSKGKRRSWRVMIRST